MNIPDSLPMRAKSKHLDKEEKKWDSSPFFKAVEKQKDNYSSEESKDSNKVSNFDSAFMLITG